MNKASLSSDVALIFELIFDGRENDIDSINDDGKFDKQVNLARTLVYMSRLLSQHTQDFPTGMAGVNFDAADLVEAITFGREHSVWDHIQQLKKQRRGPRESCFSIEFDRATVLLLLQYVKASGCADPIQSTVNRLSGSLITKGKLRGWRDRSGDRSMKICNMIREKVEFTAIRTSKMPIEVAEDVARERWIRP